MYVIYSRTAWYRFMRVVIVMITLIATMIVTFCDNDADCTVIVTIMMMMMMMMMIMMEDNEYRSLLFQCELSPFHFLLQFFSLQGLTTHMDLQQNLMQSSLFGLPREPNRQTAQESTSRTYSEQLFLRAFSFLLHSVWEPCNNLLDLRPTWVASIQQQSIRPKVRQRWATRTDENKKDWDNIVWTVNTQFINS